MKDPVLLAQYHNVYGSVDPKVSKKNALNLLEELISLHLLICSNTFAEDITGSHKMKSKRSKERSLTISHPKSFQEIPCLVFLFFMLR